MNSHDDRKLEILVGHMLRIGVTAAALVILVGAILYVLHSGGKAPDYQHFHGKPAPATHLAPVLDGIRRHDSRSIIQLGILLLVATPILRVMICLAGFALQKDRLYVLVSSTVLAVLLYSFFRT